MGSERVVLTIRSGEGPQGQTVKAPRKEIERLLSDTKPGEISDAGSTYKAAAGAVDRAVQALQESAGELAKSWKGPTAAQVQKAMQLMHASGVELSSKMRQMDEALGSYAEELPATLAKVESIPTPVMPRGTTTAAAVSAYEERKAAEDREAQKAMRELNQKMANIFNASVPATVSYELPTVAIPGDGGGANQKPVVLSELPANAGEPGSGDPLAPGTGTISPGEAGTTPTGTSPSATSPTGSGTSDPGTGTSNTAGRNGVEGTGSDPLSTQRQTGLTDNTVPSVIGDPRATESANFSPQTTSSPYTATPYTSTPYAGAPNATTLTPVTAGNTPGAPSVLGNPGALGGSSVSGGPASAVRPAGMGPGMMPFMPMGGMGAGGSDNGIEVGTHLTEERDIWTTAHTVTEPRIG
ncbi:WXG100 family type VII secretion target [Nonomuraea cavernae]|uniref:Uncharacterized protein n=1 Tax=Nonomuraea cavernae TaxID=2045107 RepID=A0A917ZI08_9ACTN|nr:WXG100 family type VII secretion target [Nonomuraea cavernae]MCA2190080.1 WXG100 family type VII secretion target [Nonomuraea cavernae]GGO83026.1 hypothetical protein GCM10012289_75630 [Nonomuraea cavernae]